MIEEVRELLSASPDWAVDVLFAAIAALIAIVVALIIHRFLFRLLEKIAHNSESEADNLVLKNIARPARYALIALALVVAAREIPALESVWEKIAGFIMPALVGWMAITILHALVKTVEMHDTADLAHDVAARRRTTRIRIFTRLATAIIVFITVALMLLSIPGVRDIGLTLMASAGLAALAVGAAAQPALKSLIAGLQMALTEPVRIGDMVVIDGNTGRIEEIKMSFVLVRMWDERVLVVPTQRFFDESFEHWSRRSEALTGAVMLHLDPIADVARIRAEFETYVGKHEAWDGRTATLLLTEAYPESVELRLAMSATSISNLFALRCDVREHMLAWLRENHEEALIRHRLEVPGGHEKAGEPAPPG